MAQMQVRARLRPGPAGAVQGLAGPAALRLMTSPPSDRSPPPIPHPLLAAHRLPRRLPLPPRIRRGAAHLPPRCRVCGSTGHGAQVGAAARPMLRRALAGPRRRRPPPRCAGSLAPPCSLRWLTRSPPRLRPLLETRRKLPLYYCRRGVASKSYTVVSGCVSDPEFGTWAQVTGVVTYTCVGSKKTLQLGLEVRRMWVGGGRGRRARQGTCHMLQHAACWASRPRLWPSLTLPSPCQPTLQADGEYSQRRHDW